MKQEVNGGLGSVPAKIIMKGTSQMSLNSRFSRIAPVVVEEDEVKFVSMGGSGMAKLYADRDREPSVAFPAPAPYTFGPPAYPQSYGGVGGAPLYASPYHDDRLPRGLAQDYERRPHVAAAFSYRRDANVMKRLGWHSARGAFRGAFRGYRRFGGYGRGSYGGRGFGRGGGYGGRGRGGFNYGGGRGMWRGGYNSGRRRGGAAMWQRRGRGIVKVSREQLDAQLDEYMAKTKTTLDTDLDNYLNQIPVIGS